MERVLVGGYDLTNARVSGGTGCVWGTGTVRSGSWVLPFGGVMVTVCSWADRSLVSRAGPTCFAYHGGTQSNRLTRDIYVSS